MQAKIDAGQDNAFKIRFYLQKLYSPKRGVLALFTTKLLKQINLFRLIIYDVS